MLWISAPPQKTCANRPNIVISGREGHEVILTFGDWVISHCMRSYLNCVERRPRRQKPRRVRITWLFSSGTGRESLATSRKGSENHKICIILWHKIRIGIAHDLGICWSLKSYFTWQTDLVACIKTICFSLLSEVPRNGLLLTNIEAWADPGFFEGGGGTLKNPTPSQKFSNLEN